MSKPGTQHYEHPYSCFGCKDVFPSWAAAVAHGKKYGHNVIGVGEEKNFQAQAEKPEPEEKCPICKEHPVIDGKGEVIRCPKA